MEWMTTEFIDVNSMKKNEKKKNINFDVIDADFKRYSIDNVKYCGSGAAKLVINMRKYETKPFTKLAGSILALVVLLMVKPQYVKADNGADDVFSTLGQIFKER